MPRPDALTDVDFGAEIGVSSFCLGAKHGSKNEGTVQPRTTKSRVKCWRSKQDTQEVNRNGVNTRSIEMDGYRQKIRNDRKMQNARGKQHMSHNWTAIRMPTKPYEKGADI
eukprot:3020031-Amphidinium_carterae.1